MPGLVQRAPSAAFGAVSGTAYVNRLSGQAFDLELKFNATSERNFARLRADVSKLLRPAASSLDAIPTSIAAFNARLAGDGYIWVDFRKLGIRQTDDHRFVTAVSGSTLTLNRDAPDDVEGEFISVGGHFFMVDSQSGNSLDVFPRPEGLAISGQVRIFDANGSPLGAATRAGFSTDPGPVGGWFTMPGEPPPWMFYPSQPQLGEPLVLNLQADIPR